MDDVLSHISQLPQDAEAEIGQRPQSAAVITQARPVTSSSFSSSVPTLAASSFSFGDEERLSPVAKSIESLHEESAMSFDEASPMNTDLLRTYIQEQVQVMQHFTPPAMGAHPFEQTLLKSASSPSQPEAEKKIWKPVRHSHKHNHRPSSPTHLPIDAYIARKQPRHQPLTSVLTGITPLHHLILHRVQTCLDDGTVTEAHADMLHDILQDNPQARQLYDDVLQVLSSRQLIQTAFIPKSSSAATSKTVIKGRSSPIRLHTSSLQPPKVNTSSLQEAATVDAQMMYLLTKMDLNTSPYLPPHHYTTRALEQRRGAEKLVKNPLHIKQSKEDLSMDPLTAPIWHDLRRDMDARQVKAEKKWQHLMDYRAGQRSSLVWHN